MRRSRRSRWTDLAVHDGRNTQTTIAIRRFRGFKGTKPLIVRGDLRNSITVVKQGDGVFVGVLRSAKTAAGQSLVNVAAVHELGSRPIVLKLTPKVRRFLHAAFRAAGLDAPAGDRPSTGIAVIKIPARPFLAPLFETHGKPAYVAGRFLDRVAQNLGGDFGRR
jgi:phage gpG-like protein